MKILMAASEVVPYAKTGGLADVVGSLPYALQRLGVDVRVIMPYYRIAKRVAKNTLKNHGEISIAMGTDLISGVTLESENTQKIPVYMVQQDDYYDRAELYTTTKGDYPDNAQRFIFFCRYIFEACKQVNFQPDIIHAHDWQTGLIPAYLKTHYANDPFFQKTKTIFTIHNIAYQGIFDYELFPMTNLPPATFSLDGFEYWGKMNFMKAGINFCDYVNTVSHKYSEEIQTPAYGYGIDGVLRARAHRLSGILNGVDYSEWNPATDTFIAANYSPNDLSGKKLCKKDLLNFFHLPSELATVPLIGIVSRLADQKGFDLLEKIMPELMKMDIGLILLGTGAPKYHKLFKKLARDYPNNVGIKIGFDNALAHKIEAGSDIFLMPSRYEPCGLNQIYSLKYGTVPVVRATGGLDDTIEHFDPVTKQGNGFKFTECKPNPFLESIQSAVKLYHKPKIWQKLIQNGMAADFSWDTSAKRYIELYQQVLKVK